MLERRTTVRPAGLLTPRLSVAVASLALTVSACAVTPPSPPALAYGESSAAGAAYAFADTTLVDISVMGQSMTLSQRGTAVYDVAFREAPSGVGVALTVRTLAATLSEPMGGSIRVDEGSVDGALEFTLDRQGNAVVSSRPRVEAEASQMISGLSLAHTFFPALPGRAATAGESWVDSLTFSGDEAAGARSESSVLRSTVVGDTLVDGRTLLRIDFEGTTTVANELEVSGMAVSQRSELDVTGLVLWDVQAGLMVEQLRTATGSGTVSVPIAPVPLPITLRSVQRTRIQQP